MFIKYYVLIVLQCEVSRVRTGTRAYTGIRLRTRAYIRVHVRTGVHACIRVHTHTYARTREPRQKKERRFRRPCHAYLICLFISVAVSLFSSGDPSGLTNVFTL